MDPISIVQEARACSPDTLRVEARPTCSAGVIREDACGKCVAAPVNDAAPARPEGFARTLPDPVRFMDRGERQAAAGARDAASAATSV